MVAMGLFLALRAKNNPTKLLFHGNFQRAKKFLTVSSAARLGKPRICKLETETDHTPASLRRFDSFYGFS
jgi:hypothetical protein